MKKYQLFILISSLSLILFACSNNPNNKSLEKEELKIIETITTQGNFIEYNEESHLFDDAELIVIARATEDFMDRDHIVKLVSHSKSETDLPPLIEDFYTNTSISITKVLKQPKSSSLKENDNIHIIEPVSLLESNDGFKKISIENYIELNKNQNYIIYLKENTYGEYGVINMNNGRFNLESTDEIKSMSVNNNEQVKHENMKKNAEKRFEKEIKEMKTDSQK